MKNIIIISLFFLQSFIFIFGKECLTSQNNSTSITCSENLTQLSLNNSHLIEMPDLDRYNQLLILHLDNNQIQLINRNYSTIEYLYITSNHIYALHLTNLSYPKLKLLDLSHNPIEHIAEYFFSDKQFPQLEILKLTNALTHINPYLIDNRLISFSTLKYLNEIYLNENELEEFPCSKNTTHIQWNLPANLKKISFGKNKLNIFDEICFSQIRNLIELDLQYNYLKNFSNLNFSFPYLSKIQFDYNLFMEIPSNFLHSSKQLIELNLSANQFNFKEIKTKKQSIFPGTLKILYLNSITSDLSCSIFENLIELEELHLAYLTSSRLEKCIFKKLIKLTTLNLRYHHLKTIDEQVFRPLLIMNQFHKLDITSHSLPCYSCSLRWLIEFLKSRNKTEVICLDQQGKEVLINTLDLPPCPSLHASSTMIIIISLSIFVILFIILCIYTYQHGKFPFSKFSSVCHMIPLRDYDRIYQSTTDDITNDNAMLVT